MKFAVFCYVPRWITALIPSSASQNDLNFLKRLETYKNTDKVCSDAAIRAFQNHLWYLTEELSVLGLYSNNVSPQVKEKMAQKLKSVKKTVSKESRTITVWETTVPTDI